MRRYACPRKTRPHKTPTGHAFMISMNESNIYKCVHVTTCKMHVQFCFVFGNNGGIMSFTKRLCGGYKKLKTSVKRDNYPNNEIKISYCL